MKLSLVLFLFVFTVTAAAQTPYFARVDSAACAKRKAEKIKSVYRFTQNYDSVKGIIPKKAKIDTVSYSLYDLQGRETEFSMKSGTQEHHVWFTYDSRGRITRKVSCNADSSRGFVERYEYNDAGQVNKRTVWSRYDRKDEVISVYLYFYDKQGHMTMQEMFRDSADVPAGGYNQKMMYTYDQRGREILMLTFNLAGDTTYIDSTIYVSGNGYRQVSYALSPQLVSGKYINTRRVISQAEHREDTLNDRITAVHVFEYHYGGAHEELVIMQDSTVRDMSGNVMVEYTNAAPTEYTYDKSGKYLFSIVYNRAHQPLYKETHSTYYYK